MHIYVYMLRFFLMFFITLIEPILQKCPKNGDPETCNKLIYLYMNIVTSKENMKHGGSQF